MQKNEKNFLTSILEMNIETQDVPGISMAIWKDGKIVYNQSVGYANYITKNILTPKHRFRIASQSKSFTAIAVLKLLEKGCFNLDDDITKHLDFLDKSYRGITIRQILCHRAGLRTDYPKTDYWFKTSDFPTALQLKTYFKKDKPVIKVNSMFKYSNLGYALLNFLIEKYAKMPFSEYLKDILNYNSELEIGVDYEPSGLYTYGHSSRNITGKYILYPFSYDTKGMQTAVGLFTTPASICTFYADLMNGKILSVDGFQKLITPHSDVPGYPEDQYCFGCISEKIDNEIWISHGGGWLGQLTDVIFSPQRQIVIATFTNGNVRPRKLTNEARKILLSSKYKNAIPYGTFYATGSKVFVFKNKDKLILASPDANSVLTEECYAQKNSKNEWIIEKDIGYGFFKDKVCFISKDNIRIAGWNYYTKKKFINSLKNLKDI